jgi:shikimate dehydrogenase
MQNAAFLAAGVDGVYVALRCSTDSVAPLLHAIADAGGGGNITIPHKLTAARAIPDAEPVVRRTGACNTFWYEDGKLRGDNTDVTGFLSAVERLLGSNRGVRALVLGAGGTARAAVCGLIDTGGHVDLLARSPGPARDLQSRLDTGGRIRILASHDEARGTAYDIVVNATPLGMEDGDALPVDLDALGNVSGVIDAVYRTGGTELTRGAIERGIASADGHDMLVGQGAAAFERWWNTKAPVDIMRAALDPPD